MPVFAAEHQAARLLAAVLVTVASVGSSRHVLLQRVTFGCWFQRKVVRPLQHWSKSVTPSWLESTACLSIPKQGWQYASGKLPPSSG
jgi:hypothetical protein